MVIIATHGHGLWVMDANPVNEKDKLRQRRPFQEPETIE
jgi:hypothetical protein